MKVAVALRVPQQVVSKDCLLSGDTHHAFSPGVGISALQGSPQSFQLPSLFMFLSTVMFVTAIYIAAPVTSLSYLLFFLIVYHFLLSQQFFPLNSLC